MKARNIVVVVVGALIAVLVAGGAVLFLTTDDAASDSSHPARPTAARGCEELGRDAMAALEDKYDARVGVHVIDTTTGHTLGYRQDERFGFASTLKALAVGVFLQTATDDQLDKIVTWTQDEVDAAGYSPVTSKHVQDGLTFSEVAEAAVRQSDNTALNILFKKLNGPRGLEGALRELGDQVTRVADIEPALNVVSAGSDDNTTTPTAFATVLERMVAGDALGTRRDTLEGWMSGNATGDTLIRASAPEGWTVADKSGGAGPIRNDVALVRGPGGAAHIVAIFTTRNDPDADYDDALVSGVAAEVFGCLTRSGD